MPHYLHQVIYTPEAWARLIATPQDRIAAIRTPIEKLGGRINTPFFSLWGFYVVVITHMPHNGNASATYIPLAAAAAGNASNTPPLINTARTPVALQQAHTS